MGLKKNIIGRSDFADFPELELDQIAVKIDTGAYTSSIHCHHIKTEEKKSKQILKFNLLDPDHEQFHEKEFVFDEFSEKIVKNSFGESEERFIIETTIELFGEQFPIELSLTNRGNMRFPVLLGRKLLENFLVDVTQTNLSSKSKQLELTNE